MNQKRLMNDGWVFTKQKLGTGFETVMLGDVEWQVVDIPHDWLIYNTHDLYETSVGWYRRNISVSRDELEGCILLQFEGVYMDSTVYVNQQEVGQWKYGYSTFEFDITRYLFEGLNEIVVKVVHQSPNSRWYSGAGIYRNVWLRMNPYTHMETDGVYVAPKKKGNTYEVKVDTELSSVIAADYCLKYQLYDPEQSLMKELVKEKYFSTNVEENSLTLSEDFVISTPTLWDLKNTNLYSLEVMLYQNGKLIQTEIVKFGLREITLDAEKGFFLNGTHMKLNGVCLHHDLGSLGAAVNKAAIRRQFSILKEMGVNAIRTAHNMPAVELMELADEMGMLIVTEAFDMWERAKTEYDYARFFPDWAKKDVESWVKRDRNHPSIILWSIGNEIYDTHAGERGQEITRMLMEYVYEYDYHHNAEVTIGSNFMPWENARKCADIVKVAGYNYAESYYQKHHEEYPDWIIYGSETASVVQSRGIYHFPLSQSVLCDDDEQCSALGNSSTSWGAKNTEACITDDRDATFSLGHFIWAGWDYIGEPTPYHTKNSYVGQIDTAGFKKDPFYIFKSEWTDYKEDPFVHICPYWDFNEGQLIDVRVSSNAPKVELFLNGKTLGTYEIDHKHGKKLLGDYQIPYQKGQLKAQAYDEGGNVVATDIVESFGDATTIRLTPDKDTMLADGQDLIFVEIEMEDKDGHIVCNANNRVEVLVTGAGRLLGLDNGDSTDYDSYKKTSRRLFSGKLLAIIGAKKEAGDIQVCVSSAGMETKELMLSATLCEVCEGISANTENEVSITKSADVCYKDKHEIPIRKIELICKEGNQLTAEKKEVTVYAKIHPENASYQDIDFRLTTAAGVDSNIAKFEVITDIDMADIKDIIEQEDSKIINQSKTMTEGMRGVRITAYGDGPFYLRATTKNGGEKVSLISVMNFTATGLGAANLSPYEFVSASLFYDTRGVLTNGNERGLATARDGISQIGFESVDFGDFGSDEITIPVFELGSSPVDIELWEGVPYEDGSRQIDILHYHKKSIWNVYQEETYRLPERLKGIKTLWFYVDNHKIHFKGFIFKKLEKAYEMLYTVENQYVYGDTFSINEIVSEGKTEHVIENIGNNVSIVFEDMDFHEGFTKLHICGHSPIDKNTIQVCFTDDEGKEVKQLCEFMHSEGYEERVFELDSIEGKRKVTFIFLPGCQFDFMWFRFEK